MNIIRAVIEADLDPTKLKDKLTITVNYFMTDIFSKEKRSEVMSKIRSKWTKQEVMVHNYLKGHKIKHKMHPKMLGNPDIILKDKKVAIFLHGCFWHKCPIHYREPKSKRKYWIPKIENNALRDKENIRILRKNDWKVAILWEHQLNDSSRLKDCLGNFLK